MMNDDFFKNPKQKQTTSKKPKLLLFECQCSVPEPGHNVAQGA